MSRDRPMTAGSRNKTITAVPWAPSGRAGARNRRRPKHHLWGRRFSEPRQSRLSSHACLPSHGSSGLVRWS